MATAAQARDYSRNCAVVTAPNLFIVGAAKCGTTAWFEYLRTHPDIYFPDTKELPHFCTDYPKQWRIQKRSEYLKYFEESGSAKVIGEGSVSYLYSEVAARNIRQFNPDAKILIFIREQEDQLPSLHNHYRFMGIENIEDFERAWRLSGKRNSTNIPKRSPMVRLLDYRQQGRFDVQIARYFSEFPPSQIRVFHFRDWCRDPRATYLEILRFLDLDDDGRREFHRVNERMRHRIEPIGRIIQSPPPWMLKLSAILKSVTGLSRPPLISTIRKMNRTRARIERPSDWLVQEIRDYYGPHNEQLKSRTSNPPLAQVAAEADPEGCP